MGKRNWVRNGNTFGLNSNLLEFQVTEGVILVSEVVTMPVLTDSPLCELKAQGLGSVPMP